MNRLRIAFIIGILGTITICPQFQWAKNGLGKELGKYLAGDFHQHTLYTDGSTTFDFVMAKNNEFGLDWWANSEHGGSRNRDGNGNFWDEYATNPIVGKVASSGGHQVMWRWQSLRDFVFPDILRNRSIYSQKMILSGLEWNVPGHEHCSTGIAGNDASAIAEFEYRFDGSDSDDIGGESQGWSDKNYTNNHSKAIEAVTWMQLHHENDGYIVFAHVERKGQGDPNYVGTGSRGYNISDFRDFNNAAPNVCIGFEGAPGHQVNSDRGFGNSVSCIDETCTSQDFGGTYGGVGFYSAKVGGLWDALLGDAGSISPVPTTTLIGPRAGTTFIQGNIKKPMYIRWTRMVTANIPPTKSFMECTPETRSLCLATWLTIWSLRPRTTTSWRLWVEN